MRRRLFPVAPAALLIALGVGAAWGAWFSATMLDWRPADGNRALVFVRENSIYLGLAGALVGAWCVRGARVGSVVFPLNAPRPWGAVLVRIYSLVAVAVTVGAAVGMVPGLIGASGSVVPIPVLGLLAAWASVLCAMAWGICFSVLIPPRFWLVGVPVGVAALMLIPYATNSLFPEGLGFSSVLLSPAWSSSQPWAGEYAPLSTALIPLLWFPSLGALGLVLAAGAPRLAPRRARRVGEAAAVFAVLTMMAAVVVTFSPQLPLSAPRPDARAVCRTEQRTEVCVAEEHESLLPFLTDVTAPILRVVNGGAPVEVIYEGAVSSLLSPLPETAIVVSSHLPRTVGEYRAQVADDVAVRLAAPRACDLKDERREQEESEGGEPAETEEQPEWFYDIGVTSALNSRLTLSAGVEVADGGYRIDQGKWVFSDEYLALKALSEDDFAAWYAEHADKIAACELSVEDLP